jgi:hypothetical protein
MWHGGREEKFIEGFCANKGWKEIAFRPRRRKKVILQFTLRSIMVEF